MGDAGCAFCGGRGCLACGAPARPRGAAREAGRLRGLRGQELVAEAEPEYGELVRAWISGLAPGTRFDADDVREALGDPERPNVMGAAIGGCARGKRRIVRQVARVRSARAERNGNTVVVWERLP